MLPQLGLPNFVLKKLTDRVVVKFKVEMRGF